MKVADTDQGEKALEKIKEAVEKLTPEQAERLSLIAVGMATAAEATREAS